MIALVEDVTPKPGRSKEQLLESISASRLNCFHTCRLQFFFRYVQGIQHRKSASLHIGTVVHSLLQSWNQARWRKTELTTERLQAQFEKEWLEEPINWEGEDEPALKAQAWDLFRAYLEKTPIKPDERVEAIEVWVEADLSKRGLTTLIGYIDLVREGGIVVDYKTAAKTPGEEKAVHLHEIQMASYGVLYREATGQKEGGIELHHLIKLKKPKIVITALGIMTEGQQSRLFRVIESYLEGVQREDWVPSPSIMSCACCEYFNQCRRWS